MLKKKNLFASIILISLIGFTGCGGNKNKKAEDSSSSSSSSIQSSQSTSKITSSTNSKSAESSVSNTSTPISEAIEYIGPEDTPDINIEFSLSNDTSGNVIINASITNQSSSNDYFISPEDFQLYVMDSTKAIVKTLTGEGSDIIIPANSSKELTNIFGDNTITQEYLNNSYAIAYGEGPNSHTVYESDTSGKLSMN